VKKYLICAVYHSPDSMIVYVYMPDMCQFLQTLAEAKRILESRAASKVICA
jgi:uncharacterized protein YcgL (UPF0745 family)